MQRVVFRDFNPRSPCGERHGVLTDGAIAFAFQSTLPMRGATNFDAERSQGQPISIHAPHAGSDFKCAIMAKWNFQFQSTLPMRGATLKRVSRTQKRVFQSTLPMRGATSVPTFGYSKCRFQSTLPMRGATRAHTVVS